MERKLIALSLLFLLAVATAQALPSSTANPTLWKSQSSPIPATAGGTLFLSVTIQNYGAKNADSLSMTVKEKYPFSLRSVSDKVQSFETLCSLCSKEIDYQLLVDPAATDGTYTLDFDIAYNDGGSKSTRTQTVTVTVQGRGKAFGISSTNASKESFAPGDIGTLSLTLQNFGKTDVSYASASLNLPAGITVLDTNKRYLVETIAPGKTLPVTFKISIDGDAAAKIYSIPVNLSYIDSTGTERNSVDTIGIAVKSKPRLVVALSDNTYFQSGRANDIVVSVANAGPTAAKYVIVEMKENGYSVIGSRTVYIGDMASDDFETAEFAVLAPAGARDVELTAAIKYFDTFNQEYTDDVTIPIKFYTPGEIAALTGKGGSNLMWIVGGVVLLGVGYWYYRRRHRK